jgi:hypothetical protein
MLKRVIHSKYIYLSIFILSVAYFSVGLNFDINLYDEGVGLIGAERLSGGQLPYHDFWTIYTPLNYYFLAGFSFVSGYSIILTRILSLLIAVLTVMILHKIIRLANDNQAKLWSGIMLIIVAGYSLFFARGMGIALMLSAASIYFLVRLMGHQSKKKMLFGFLSGLLCGFTILTRIDTGFFLFSSILLTFLTLRIFNKYTEYEPGFNYIKLLFIVLTGVLSAVLPLFVYFASVMDLRLIYDQIIQAPLSVYSAYRKLPRLHIWDVIRATDLKNAFNIFWFGIYSLFTGSIAIVIIEKVWRNRKTSVIHSNRILTALPLIIFAVLLLAQTIVRPDYEHFIPTWLFALTAMLAYLDYNNIKPQARNFSIVFLLMFASYFLIVKYSHYRKSCSDSYSSISSIPRANGIIINNDWKRDLESAVNYIRNNSGTNEKIFVANDRHDRGYRCDVMFYYLSERLPGTKYHELHPGVVSKKVVQTEILNELINNNVRCIVRVMGINSNKEPNLSSESSGVFLLDNFINSNYHIVQDFGMYRILIKN